MGGDREELQRIRAVSSWRSSGRRSIVSESERLETPLKRPRDTLSTERKRASPHTVVARCPALRERRLTRAHTHQGVVFLFNKTRAPFLINIQRPLEREARATRQAPPTPQTRRSPRGRQPSAHLTTRARDSLEGGTHPTPRARETRFPKFNTPENALSKGVFATTPRRAWSGASSARAPQLARCRRACASQSLFEGKPSGISQQLLL